MKRSSKASPRERKVQSNKSQVQTKQGYHAGNIIKCSGYQNNRIKLTTQMLNFVAYLVNIFNTSHYGKFINKQN